MFYSFFFFSLHEYLTEFFILVTTIVCFRLQMWVDLSLEVRFFGDPCCLQFDGKLSFVFFIGYKFISVLKFVVFQGACYEIICDTVKYHDTVTGLLWSIHNQ